MARDSDVVEDVQSRDDQENGGAGPSSRVPTRAHRARPVAAPRCRQLELPQGAFSQHRCGANGAGQSSGGAAWQCSDAARCLLVLGVRDRSVTGCAPWQNATSCGPLRLTVGTLVSCHGGHPLTGWAASRTRWKSWTTSAPHHVHGSAGVDVDLRSDKSAAAIPQPETV